MPVPTEKAENPASVMLPVFDALRAILERHGPELKVTEDRPGTYTLVTAAKKRRNDHLYYAGLQMRDTYVSLYLMPLYMNPKLTERMSPALRRCRKGKSCLHFNTVNPTLFGEVEKMAAAGLACYREAGYL